MRLEALPACHIPLRNATLSSAIRLLADEAHMAYFAPPEGEFTERISSDVSMNPYDELQILSETYNLGLEFKHHVWRFYAVNLNELVTKAYTIRFNNLQQVSIASSSINSQLASASGGMTGGAGGVSGQGAGMSGGMAGLGGGGGMGSGGPFNAKTGKIIEDIKKILDVPTVGLNTPTLDSSPTRPDADASRKGQAAPRIEPIWNPDTSQLFVVATRQQHSLIQAYLKTVDRPQKLVRIAVKFVETSRNPTTALGVDWSQTLLGSGGPISLAGQSSSTNTSASSGNQTATTSSSLSALSSNVKLGHLGSLQLPAALLSAPAFQWTMSAIATDQSSSVVQDPVLFTANNREVTFKATTEQPIQEGSTTFGSATAATSSEIAYIEIGTSLTVLPTVLPGTANANKPIVVLSLSINVSSITGSQTIGGNPYPITSTRAFSYSVPIPSGQTLAIAGLEQRTRQLSDNKVPIFGDIPLIGYAFKNKSDSVVHTNLMAFITPEVVDEFAPGLAEEDRGLPACHHRVFQGTDKESLAEVNASLNGLSDDIAALETAANPANRDAVLNRYDQIAVELSLIEVRLGELKMNSDKLTALQTTRVDRDRELLLSARSKVAGIIVAAQ
jgi:type II secretory pathway component GspD/PulD (secretin)